MTQTSRLDPRRRLRAVVLAAGRSKRMKTDTPKVLHELCGRPLIDYVLDALAYLGVPWSDVCVVVGFGADRVREHLRQYQGIRHALQEQQLGTGHAVACAADFLRESEDPVLVLAGDMPLVTGSSLQHLYEAFLEEQAACAIGTAYVTDPHGLGRIVRDESGRFVRIVEEVDASPDERQIREINTSIYVFDSSLLLRSLKELRPTNRQSELYLTDCPTVLQQWGHKVIAVPAFSEEEAAGINSRRELARAHGLMQRRIHQHWMDEGVTILDPATVYIDSRVTIGRDTVIHPFVYIDGPSEIGSSCVVGPFAYVAPHSEIPDHTVVRQTMAGQPVGDT